MSHWGDIADVTDDVIAAQFAVCLDHAVRISRDLFGRVAAASGSMVFISSVSGLHGAPRHAAYGMAKAALISWVKSLAVELGASGVRANSIAPGTVLTPAALPQFARTIAHLRDVLGDQTYESLARKGETMTTAAMATYAYDQIGQARAELNAVSK